MTRMWIGDLEVGDSAPWILSKTNWFTPAGNNVAFTSRQNGHGSFPIHDSDVIRSNRTLSISGTWVGGSADMLSARDKLSSFQERVVVVRFQSGDVDQFVSGVVDVDLEDVGYGDHFSWSITVTCDDPRRYSWRQQRVSLQGVSAVGAFTFPVSFPIDFVATGLGSNTGLLSNAGKAKAHPTIVVHGDHPSGFTLSDNLGRSISFNGPVLAASPVTFDCLARSCTVNGVDRAYMLGSRDWFDVEPGGSLAISFLPAESSPTGWADVSLRDTWL